MVPRCFRWNRSRTAKQREQRQNVPGTNPLLRNKNGRMLPRCDLRQAPACPPSPPSEAGGEGWGEEARDKNVIFAARPHMCIKLHWLSSRRRSEERAPRVVQPIICSDCWGEEFLIKIALNATFRGSRLRNAAERFYHKPPLPTLSSLLRREETSKTHLRCADNGRNYRVTGRELPLLAERGEGTGRGVSNKDVCIDSRSCAV
jgi:hypothetical protein